MEVSAYGIATRFVGIREIPGQPSHPMILAMLKLREGSDFDAWPEADEVPWCSAFVNFVCWILRLPRSKSLRARSWLGVGRPIPLDQAVPGYDVVILTRGGDEEPPGPENMTAPGHVGFFAGAEQRSVFVLGGNQNDGVTVQAFDRGRVLGVRRLREGVFSHGPH